MSRNSKEKLRNHKKFSETVIVLAAVEVHHSSLVNQSWRMWLRK